MYLHPDTYVNELMEVSVFKVPQHRGVVQVGQVGHVVDFVKFWRIHLQNLLFFQILFLEHFREEEALHYSKREYVFYCQACQELYIFYCFTYQRETKGSE